ncbi:MAG TPA: OmpA family protein [Rhizomicrobium sp.]|jgi:outer membrane protein OmpA-like peptidoglycan-associated protein|nr:OmpA family protein [Rhizomicrobium sp.]
MRRPLFLLAPFAAVLLAGCAARETVIVLPAADGHVGGVVVESGGKTVVLDKAYASDHPGDAQAGEAKPEEVNQGFTDVLAARPIQPGDHKLYFKNDSDEMTDDSKVEFNDKVFADVHRRAAAEIVIIGHTDTTGETGHNDGLSRDRAEAIKKLLLDRHSELPPNMGITTAGRGQRDDRDPANTPNPNERYVEIIVQ